MKRRVRRSRRRPILAAVALAAATGGGCSPTYVARAGWEEARILAKRRPIREVVHDTATPPALRAKLRLVQDSRDFAERTLGLNAGASFRSFAPLTRDTLVLNISAAPEFELRWKTWWFPIVGRVPYRGYFNFRAALREADRLRKTGYDVWVRPVAAFSTLGWLPDPVLPTTLRLDSVALVETIVHETTHTTFFPAGRAHFNESFANFVGNRGAILFFCEVTEQERLCEAARDRWADTRVFGRFFQSLARPLQNLYARNLPADTMRERKRRIFADAADRFRNQVRPRLKAGRYRDLEPERLNNAWVLSRLLYYTRLDDFEQVYRQSGDLTAAIHRIITAASQGDPWRALDALARRPVTTATQTPSSPQASASARRPPPRTGSVRSPPGRDTF
ncbi:MAG: aminopeptidase [Gemmatimonadota bacterium]